MTLRMSARFHKVDRGERVSLLKRLYPLRHCERSEAIQPVSVGRFWIASLRSQ
ncbi:hypothetical protein ACVWXQ_001952 [Bradyrhizobium sp. S3.14.4]|jgi:hypothetical protein